MSDFQQGQADIPTVLVLLLTCIIRDHKNDVLLLLDTGAEDPTVQCIWQGGRWVPRSLSGLSLV